MASQFTSYLDGIHFATKTVLALTCGIFILSCFILPLSSFCLIPSHLSHWTQWYRVLTFPWFHMNFLHLFFNIMTFIPLGNSLEKQIGSLQFLHLMLLFSLASGMLQSLLSLLFFILSFSFLTSAFHSCSAGLSGVIFGLIAIDVQLTSSTQPTRRIFLFSIPSFIYPWALLLFVQFLVPQVSFLGHLAGLLIGYLFSWGWLRNFQLTNAFLASLEGKQTLTTAWNRVGGFVQHRDDSLVLPVFVPPNPSEVRNSVQGYFSQLSNAWRAPTASAGIPAPSDQGPPPPYSQASHPAPPPQAVHFPGKGQVLGSSS